MTDNYILAASGRPFRDWDAAEMKRLIIATELADDTFEVVRHFRFQASGKKAAAPL
jgi:1-deoxy-D-xylulose 5-phosphate reductoisomerase